METKPAAEFKREQIGVQLDKFGNLSITGERPLVDSRSRRFHSIFQVPEECNEIRAKFENGRLSVKVLPKLIIETSLPAAVPKEKEDEKGGEPIDTRKDAEKVGEKEKDQIEEKEDKKKLEQVQKPSVPMAELRAAWKGLQVALQLKKEQIRVQLDNFGNLRISGERPLADNKWSRFHKMFQVPEDCNVAEIQAKFENGSLYVKLPKLITEPSVKDRPTEAQKPKENQKPTSRPSVEPDGVPKIKEDEPTDARKDAEKEREKEKDQTKEKKDKEKVTSDVKRDEGEKGGAITDVPKEEAAAELAAPGNGQYGLGKLKTKLRELGLDFYKPRELLLSVLVGVVVLVGVGLYVTYKRRSPMEEDGH
ncbi:putative inactive protein RESTRICTED TEV MOVEMENT 2 [Cocos nucifera]|uniref:Putative inactive protein RESTRICTED TEV MOVEMENT 2 n=1 Tax=Cocos nucifera TaxID=13894 RepID=A0A8K0I1V8_COCNU|nr:putative inactive protein RESTRICTED TEV MOVEMENT 2 [Cocos nucifera]